ncbi:MAG: response regulator transcription factor [Dehalococcoidia bacterium]|jgi:DNA-binding NarL/FixJ family response regulator|nr:response regulator transcription factor [Dehalococcoidia bacterium]
MSKIRVLIVDDHPVVREGLAAMLERQDDIAVVGEAADGAAAIQQALDTSPDVILMDLRMPVMDGVEAMRKIGAQVPSAHVIVLTTYDNDEYIFRGIEAGARAYLLKDAPRDELFHAIREVHQGKSLIDPSVVDKVFERFASQSKLTSGQEALSEREKGILRLMATGAPNKAIAAQLYISESTVKTHVQSIFQKLGVNDRTEAVTRALQMGIISL